MVWAVTTLDPFRFQGDQDHDFLTTVDQLQPPRKSRLSATDELRHLRKKVERLENQMHLLCAKWLNGQPDNRVRYQACVAARSKWRSSQSEQLNRELRTQLTQQQLYLASLQHNLTQSPLLEPSRSKDIFQALHRSLNLSGHQSAQQRVAQLQLQCQLMLKSMPTVIKRFSSRHLAKATPERPFSHTSIMADTSSTYVSSILLYRVQNLSLDAAFHSLLHYSSDRELIHSRLGIRLDSQLIHDVGFRQQYLQLSYRNGRHVSSTMRSLFAAQLRADEAVIACDFVEQDDLLVDPDESELQRQFCYGIHLRREVDTVTAQEQVLLQRMVAVRYNWLPDSMRLQSDIQSAAPWVNGDLLLEQLHRIAQHFSPIL